MTGEEIFDIERPCKTELNNLIKAMKKYGIKSINISSKEGPVGNFGITEIHTDEYYNLDMKFNDGSRVSRLMSKEDFK